MGRKEAGLIDVGEIVFYYLRRYRDKYDGLVSDYECACEMDDLAPCGEMKACCEAGHKVFKDADGKYPGDDDEGGLACCPGCIWHMVAGPKWKKEKV